MMNEENNLPPDLEKLERIMRIGRRQPPASLRNRVMVDVTGKLGKPERRYFLAYVSAAAAAAIVAVVILWSAFGKKSHPTQPPPIAENIPPPPPSTVQISSPLMPQTEIALRTVNRTLPGGTKVVFQKGAQWRSFDLADSPDIWTGASRSARGVELLSGQAGFDVVEGADPFVVKTPACNVQVMGTQFEINVAQMEEKGNAKMDGDKMRSLVTVAVLAGTVAVFNSYGGLALVAGEQAVVQEGQAPVAKGNVNVPAPAPNNGPSVATTTMPASAPAYGLELKDKVNLGVKLEIDGNACFTPNGKNILTASFQVLGDKVERHFVYTLISPDGKEKQIIYKAPVDVEGIGDLIFPCGHVFLPFSDRRGNISPDGRMFIVPLIDKDREETLGFFPFMLGVMDGTNVKLPDIDAADSHWVPNLLGFTGMREVAGKRVSGGNARFSGVFDNDGMFYYTLSGRNPPSINIYRFDPQKGAAQKISQINNLVQWGPIVISPDRTKIAGIALSGKSEKIWVCDVKSGQTKTSESLKGPQGPDLILEMRLAWSLDGTAVYFRDRFGNLISYRPQQAGGQASVLVAAAGKKDLMVTTFTEIAPGYLFVNSGYKGSSNTVSIVNTSTGDQTTLTGPKNLTLMDKFGDLGLFVDSEKGLWTAKIVFTPPATQPASRPTPAGP
ncbi:MAG: FecR domain-containing protein [Planctomycetes bacterium]|nr:FecR domain-containing protein [Planctomycetota bacterium]